MDCTSGTAKIPGAPDAELGNPRPQPLTYHWTLPAGPARGLVFVIHGFGQDAAADYDQKLRSHLASTHGLAAVTVEYHAFRARPETGAAYEFPDESVLALQGICCRVGVHDPVNAGNVLRLVQAVGPRLGIPVRIKVRLRPADGTLQNFGVIQALDHLRVLAHLKHEGLAFDRSRVLLFGSSHGGYLAHLVHKFAPNTFSGLLDNSGYTQANPYFLGLGSEFTKTSGNLILDCNVLSAWTHDNVFARDHFGSPRRRIRDVSDIPHFLALAKASRRECRIRSVNSCQDSVSPVGFKRAQRELYRQLGFDVDLLEVGGPAGDPDFVKSAGHADVSLKKLFDHFAPQLFEARLKGPADDELQTALEFECDWLSYRIRHRPGNAGPSLEVVASG